MIKKSFDLQSFSKYRNLLMGISILSIMVFHYGESVGIAINRGDFTYADMNIVLSIIARLANAMGSIGVEVFLFLSGVGLFYSFDKNPDIKAFYKKRIVRVLIPYFIYAPIYLIIKDLIVLHKGFIYYILDVFSIEYILHGEKLFWYIYMIVILYLIYPFIYKVFKTETKKKYIRLLVFIVGYSALLLVLNGMWSYFDRFEIILTRVLIFVIGCAMAEDIKKGKRFKRSTALCIMLLFLLIKVAVYVLPHGRIIGRFVAVPYSIGFMMFFIFFFEFCQNKNISLKIIDLAGIYSLELYLTHVSLRRLSGYLGFGTYHILNYLVVLLISVLISYIFKKVTSYVVKSI